MTRSRRSRRERGVALLLVLWVFLTLGVLALDFSQYMRDDAMASVNMADETRGYYVALAGLNRALYEASRERQENPGGATPPPITGEDDDVDVDGDGEADGNPFPLDGTWHEGEFDGAKFEVRLIGEDGRLPLNFELTPDNITLFTELLRAVVTNIVRGGNETEGVDRREDEAIRTIVDSVIDWRDCDSETQVNGAEDDYYLGQRRPHRAKNGYFDSVEELLQIRGVTPELFFGGEGRPGLRDVFSIYPKGQELEINARQNTPEVLSALFPVVDGLDVDELVQSRQDDPQALLLWLQQNIDTIVPGLSARVREKASEVVRVEARGDLTQKRNQAAVGAVVQLGEGFEGPNILAWIDRSPVPPRDQPEAGSAAQEGPQR